MLENSPSATYELMSAAPDLSSLGPYPIIQILGTLAVFGLSFLFWILGTRSADKPPVADVHLDGPLVAASRELARMAKAVEAATVSVQQMDELREKFSEFRRDIYERIDRQDAETERDLREMREHIHRVELSIASVARRRT